jgi:acylphosphatase
MDIITKKITVSGFVQMVGYRWYAKQKADICRVKGYVKNTARGDVDIVAQGNPDDILTFIDFLKLGPSRARVDKVISSDVTNEKIYHDFNITM